MNFFKRRGTSCYDKNHLKPLRASYIALEKKRW